MAWLAKARRQLVIQQSDWEGEDRSCLRDDGTYLGFVTSYKPSKRANNIAISLVGEAPPDGRKRQPEYWVAWEWVRSRLILHAGETRDSLVLDRRRAKRQERSARVAISGVSGGNVGPNSAAATSNDKVASSGEVATPPRNRRKAKKRGQKDPAAQAYDVTPETKKAVAYPMPVYREKAGAPEAVHDTPQKRRQPNQAAWGRNNRSKMMFKEYTGCTAKRCRNDCSKLTAERVLAIRKDLTKAHKGGKWQAVRVRRMPLTSGTRSTHKWNAFHLLTCSPWTRPILDR